MFRWSNPIVRLRVRVGRDRRPGFAPVVLARRGRVDADWLCNVLDLLLAEKIEPAGEFAFDGVVDGGGDANAAALGEGLHARGDIDAISIYRAVCLLDHIA